MVICDSGNELLLCSRGYSQPVLPSIFLTNIRSIHNKLDYLLVALQLDRIASLSGKTRGSGRCVYFNRLVYECQRNKQWGGADTASDHHLLVGKFKLWLKRHHRAKSQRVKHWKPSKAQVVKFKDILSRENTELQLRKMEGWTINSTCEEALWRRIQKHKEWITPETLNTIQQWTRADHHKETVWGIST